MIRSNVIKMTKLFHYITEETKEAAKSGLCQHLIRREDAANKRNRIKKLYRQTPYCEIDVDRVDQ